jgi:hypothetical protein
MRAWVAVALAAGMVSGCAGLDGPDACDPGAPAGVWTPWTDGRYLETDPRTTWDTVVLSDGGDSGVPSLAPPGGGAVWSERLSPEGAAGNFSALRVRPGGGPLGLDLPYSYEDCTGSQEGAIHWDLARPAPGDAAQPGQGALVHTAGFWENGTLFYTNIASIDKDDWPRAGWYAWEGGDPLPVYVYGRDRSEQPPHWKDPAAGTPVAGKVPGLGYYTTIPGFNEALKGLSTQTARVVWLAPEEAYTRPGAEEHPLYGHALVFYIKVVGVVDLPCPMQAAEACADLSMG